MQELVPQSLKIRNCRLVMLFIVTMTVLLCQKVYLDNWNTIVIS